MSLIYKILGIFKSDNADAMDNAQEMMAGLQNMKEFNSSKVQFEVLNYTVG